MTITLSKQPIRWRKVKIFHCANYDSDPVELPYSGIKGRSGFELANFERVTVDGYDSCVFRHYSGRIIDKEGLKNVSETVDLIGQVIYVMVEDDAGDYYTEWVGRCYAQMTSPEPGASVNLSMTEYHCTGIMKELDEVMMDYFADYQQTVVSRGHPGFNMMGGVVVGDRDSSNAVGTYQGVSIPAHRIPENSDESETEPWTDKQTLDQAFAIAALDKIVSSDSAPFTVVDSSSLLTGVQQWPVDTARTTVAKHIRSVCAKQRGILAFWDFTVAANVAKPSLIYLKVVPMVYDDITWTNPKTGSPLTINGANNSSTAINLDLVGDHRLVDGSFNAPVVASSTYDRLESFSEPIQILVSCNTEDGTLERAWSDDQAAAAASRSVRGPDDPRHATAYRTYRVLVSSGGEFGDCTGTGDKSPANYAMDDDGNIIHNSDFPLTSMSIKVLPDTPLLNGINYANTSLDKINSDDNLLDNMRLPVQMYRWLLTDISVPTGTSGKDRTRTRLTPMRSELDSWMSISLSLSGPGNRDITVKTALDGAKRYGQSLPIVASGDPNAPGDSNLQIVFTLAIESPHRMRMATSKDTSDDQQGTSGRTNTKRMYFPGLHLHLAHPLAIWSIQNIPNYNCASGIGSLPGRIRDDRDQLARLHAIATEWYLRVRRTLGYSMRCAGFRYFTQEDDTVTNYPRMGQVIYNATYAGETHVVNTPVTRISYNHDSQVTSWTTGWTDRDWSR